MQTPVDAFYGTLQNIANLESTEAANKLNQMKLAAIVDAEKQKKDDLSTIAQAYQSQSANQPSFAAPQPTGLSDIAKGSIDEDFNASMGLGKEPPKAEAPKKSYAQILLSDADKQRQIGESLRKAGSPNAQQYFDAADKILEKAAPLMKEERQAEMARIKEYGNKLAFVTDQATLDAALSGADSMAVDQVFGNKLPRGLDGRILATPNVIKLANDIGKMSIDAAKRMEIENTTRQVVNQETETKRKIKDSEEGTWAQRQKAAADREANRIREKEVDRKANESVNAETAMTDDAINSAAEKYRLTGQLPSLGIGKNGAVMKAKILDRAAELAKSAGESNEEQGIRIVANKANQAALAQITKQEQMVGAFEKNALKNLDIALQASKDVDRTGVPVLNRWLLAGRKSIAGDPAVSKFHAANTTFVNEYAKIMSGSMGNTVVSDSLRKETESLLATKDTPEQYEATVSLMKQEMANRMKGFAEQKDLLFNSMRSAPKQQKTDPDIDAAKAAIAQGAPRDAVIQRLKTAGKDITGL